MLQKDSFRKEILPRKVGKNAHIKIHKCVHMHTNKYGDREKKNNLMKVGIPFRILIDYTRVYQIM